MAHFVLPIEAPNPRAVLGWDGVDWRVPRVHDDGTVQVRGEDQLFSYGGQIIGNAKDLNADAGLSWIELPAIDTGDIWVITAMSGMNWMRACPNLAFGIVHELVIHIVGAGKTDAAQYTFSWAGTIFLGNGDYLWANYAGCTAGDDVYFYWFGHLMTPE